MAPGRLLSLAVSVIGAAILVPSASCTTDVRNVGKVTDPPIQILVWNNALAYGHPSRISALPKLTARQITDNLNFDLGYAHTIPVDNNNTDADTSFDPSVFTDAGLDRYDVVLFLNTTGLTIDDELKDMRRQALQDFIEKKGRGFVGTHSATDTYQNGTWPWYVDFIGTNYDFMKPTGPSGASNPGMLQLPPNTTAHPILIAAGTPIPWMRSDEWFTFKSDPTGLPGFTILLNVTDTATSTLRPSVWIHELPPNPSAPRPGRMFYTACCHNPGTFDEPEVIDLIVAGIKWAAHRM